MKCLIQRDKFGRVRSAKTESGQESELFKKAASQPFVNSMEEGADMIALTNTWVTKISTSPEHRYITGEPKVFYKTPQGFTESYREALTTSAGNAVEFGFIDRKGEMLPVTTIVPTLNNDSPIGIINNAIVNNQLKDSKEFDGMGYALKGAGQSLMESQVSANQVFTELSAIPGNNISVFPNGTLRAPYSIVTLPEVEQEATPIIEALLGNVNEGSSPTELQTFKSQFERELNDILERSIEDGTFMMAPNGKKTNLTEREWLTTRHPSFINWFGDFINDPENASKVVDENGDPRKVYHGSGQMGFHIFNISDVNDGGHFFAGNIQMARSYTPNNVSTRYDVATTAAEAIDFVEYAGGSVEIEEEDGETSYIVFNEEGREEGTATTEEELINLVNTTEFNTAGVGSFFLNLRDPGVIEGYGDNWDDIKGAESADLEVTLNYDNDSDQYNVKDYDGTISTYPTFEEAIDYIEDRYDDYAAEQVASNYEDEGVGYYKYSGDIRTGEEAPPGQTTREWVNEVKDWDADGVIFNDIDDNGPHGYSGSGDVFVAFNSEDIKSTDNVGQFDVQNEDVRFSTQSINSQTEAISEIASAGFLVPEIGTQTNPEATIDVESLKARAEITGDVPVVSINEFEGIPMMFGISDELTTGDVTNPTTGNTISNLHGGLGFNSTSLHKDYHWANVDRTGAATQLEIANKIYNTNKELFENLWQEGKIPNGQIPVAIAKMGEGAIDSNEAVMRVALDTLTAFKPFSLKKNQKKLVSAILSDLNTKNTQKLFNHVSGENYTNVSDIITDIISHRDSSGKEYSLKDLSFVNKLLVNSNSKFREELAKLGFTERLNIASIRDVIKDPAFNNVNTRDIISIVGIDVINPEIKKTNHPHYPWGLNGGLIGILSNPTNLVDVFPTMRSSVINQLKDNKKLENALAWGIPTGMGLTNINFRGDKVTTKMSEEELLAGFLRLALPGVNFNLNQASWDLAINNPNVQRFVSQNGQIEGFTDGQSIFVNPQLKSNKVLLHEAGHIWGDYMRSHSKESKELWGRGLELTEGTKELEKAQKIYGDTDLAKEEALMELIASKGNTILETQKKSKLEQWLSDVWSFITSNFKSSGDLLKSKTIDTITLDDFLGAAVYDLLSGKKLTYSVGAYSSVWKDKGNNDARASFQENPFNSPGTHPTKPNYKYVKVGNTGVAYSENDNLITLAMIETPIENRKSGEATAAMNQLIAYADANGKSIDLFVSPRDRATTEKQLFNFYERFGFRQKYGGIEQEMIRNPRKPRFSTLGWDASKGPQKLPGSPSPVGASGADLGLNNVAEQYAKDMGIDFRRQSEYVEVDVDRAKRIAQAYEDMKHDPQDPIVREAFQNLIAQTKRQYEYLVNAGYNFYFYDSKTDPYDGNPTNAMRDLRNNKTMAVYVTDDGYGTGEQDVLGNPMLEETEFEWSFGSPDGPKQKVLANDLFRAVHDAFGHGLEGAGFRARGEENAWQAHARLFTGSALAAITTETRGQNSWLNYGPYGDKNRTASLEETTFAPQKIGIMPEWTWKEGFNEGIPTSSVTQVNNDSLIRKVIDTLGSQGDINLSCQL